MFFPEKSLPKPSGAPSPFLESYFKNVERVFTPEDMARIDAFLEKIVYAKNGEVRDYNDIVLAIFSLENDRDMAILQDKLEKGGQSRLRDYLLTKVDVLIGRYQPTEEKASRSGVFPIAKIQEAAQGEPSPEKKNKIIKHREASEMIKHEPVSKMNLEALLSRETIGALDPPTMCQCDYDFFLPEADGMGHPQEAEVTVAQIRSVPMLEESDLGVNDLVITLPASRIRNGVLPAPAGYEVVGSLDQALELADPNDENPFCTRMQNPIEGRRVRYVVKLRSERLRFDAKKFLPDEKERQLLKETLPFPERERSRGAASVAGARQAILEHMRDRFLYICDDRIGQFIERHPDELGTIVDGLRVGHCDLLAWSAAAYFRQLGHTAFVVNTEITADSGEGFYRNMTHSRVAVIRENSVLSYFDPTTACEAVKGYGLSHISDEEIAEMEQAFEAADSEEEKKAALRTFRALIDERESLRPAEPFGGNKEVDCIADDESVLSGIDVTDDDVFEAMSEASRFFEHPMSETQKQEMNKLCDVLAARRLSLASGIVNRLKLAEDWSAYPREAIERHLNTGQRPSAFFMELLAYEKVMRAIFPEFVEAQYERIENRDYRYLEGKEVYTERLAELSIGSIPEKEKLMTYRKDFTPQHLSAGESYPGSVIMEQMLFRKLVGAALADEEARAFLKTRFGVDEQALKDYAVAFEPKLSPKAKIKNVVTTTEAFSGKKTKEEYLLFCRRAEKLYDALVPDYQEYRLASADFLGVLSRLHLTAVSDKMRDLEGEKDLFNQTLTEYVPGAHALHLIDEQASERLGKLMAKTERRARPMIKPLCVYVDTEFMESTSNNVFTHFVRMRVILESLVKFSRLKKIPITVSSGSNDYFQITPQSRLPMEVLLMRLLYERIDRKKDDEERMENYGFRTKDGLPKNLLYLSANQGKVNAVKYVLGKSTNVIAKNFSDIGLDVFPRFSLNEPPPL